MAELLCPYQDQIQRRAEVRGLGVDSAQQSLAEVSLLRILVVRLQRGIARISAAISWPRVPRARAIAATSGT